MLPLASAELVSEVATQVFAAPSPAEEELSLTRFKHRRDLSVSRVLKEPSSFAKVPSTSITQAPNLNSLVPTFPTGSATPNSTSKALILPSRPLRSPLEHATSTLLLPRTGTRPLLIPSLSRPPATRFTRQSLRPSSKSPPATSKSRPPSVAPRWTLLTQPSRRRSLQTTSAHTSGEHHRVAEGLSTVLSRELVRASRLTHLGPLCDRAIVCVQKEKS